jgi:hypothetical protein
LNGETNRATQRRNSAIIVADVRRFAHVINTDGVLGMLRTAKTEAVPSSVRLPSSRVGLSSLQASA